MAAASRNMMTFDGANPHSGNANSVDPSKFDFLSSSPFGHIVYTPDLVILDVNERHSAMTGRDRQDLLGLGLFEAFPANPEDPEADAEPALRESVARVMATGEPDEMPVEKHDITDPNGAFVEHYWQITHSAIRTEGEIVAILQTLRDVTHTVLREKFVEAQKRTATNGTSVASLEYDPVNDVLVCSEDVEALFGYDPGTMPATGTALFERIHPEDRDRIGEEFRRLVRGDTGASARFNYRALWPDGTERGIVSRVEVVRAPETQTQLVVGALIDVTELQEGEAQLREAVEARDLLLVEVNHRVKNSLQLVTSVLNMEASDAERSRETGADRLRAAAARVSAIATVHAALYHGGDVRTVEFDVFLETLTRHLAIASGAAARGIDLQARTEPARISTDRAISLSLVVNELVTDALKHAFLDEARGSIRVSLRRIDPDRIALEVSDDGTGRTSRALDTASDGLGQHLVDTLARQVDAKMDRDDNGSGLRVRLEMPL